MTRHEKLNVWWWGSHGLAVLAILAAVLFACTPQPEPRPPVQDEADSSVVEPPWPPPPASDAAPRVFVPASGSLCAQACAVLDFVGCPEAAPTPRGQSCERVCIGAEAFRGLSLRPAEVALCRDKACVRRAGVKCAVQ